MIPEFLRRENVVENTSELIITLEEYEKKFGLGVSLDWLQITEEEWIEVLNECVRTGKSFEEIFGKVEYEEDADY